MKRKAQVAMEFLMTYGWAILVVLIAVGVLAYFGVFQMERFLPEKCVVSTGSGMFCDDFSIDSNALVRLNVHNILNEGMTGITVTLTNPAGGSCTNAVAVDIAADSTEVVSLACSPVLDPKVKGDLVIVYTVGGFQKTTTGTLGGRVP